MRDDEHPESQAASPRLLRRGPLALIVLVGGLLAFGAVATQLRSDEATPPESIPEPRAESSSTTLPEQASAREEVEARLREILQVRDKALLARNAKLLKTIYTVDCKCLDDGKALISQLHREGVVWKGVRTNVTIERSESVNERLWILIATVTTPSVRIETESGTLIRTVPPERNQVRFGLAKPQNEEEWLLGHASTVD